MHSKKITSIIIPTYNEEKDIAGCLKSLESQSEKNFEIIVVDDGSTDRTRDIVKKFGKVRLVEGSHKGPGASRNLGAEKAKGSILVFVDADMTFEKNYIGNLIAPILADKSGRIIGTTHDYEVAINTGNWISRLWGRVRVDYRAESKKNDAIIFRAIRKDKFLELGGFNPKYGYADDQTFWLDNGIKPTVAKNTRCYHKNPESLKGTFGQARWIGASWKERFWIFRIPVLNYISALAFILLLPLIILIKSAVSRRTAGISFFNLIKYYSYKFTGYAAGIFRVIYLRKF